MSEIRDNADWRRVFDALGLMRDERRSKIDDWWASSPFAADSDPSFHINDGGWYCFSSGQGGGVLELVQQVHNLDCYAAGRWLLEHGLSHCGRVAGAKASPAPPPSGEKRTEAPKRAKAPNTPIRQNLLPALSPEHPELTRRGLSAATCAYLGCGAYAILSRS